MKPGSTSSDEGQELDSLQREGRWLLMVFHRHLG